MTSCRETGHRLSFCFRISRWHLAVAAGHQNSPPAPEIPLPAIRVTTHIVLVDVVVTDHKAKARTDSVPKDFVI